MTNRLRWVGLAVVLLLEACGGGSGSSSSVVPPSGLSYSSPQTCYVGTAIQTLTPTVNGSVTSYSVSPPLPAGLSLNSSSGVISGTPTVATPLSVYTVAASNSGGQTTFGLAISVGAARATHTVGGTLSGLASSQRVALLNNGGDSLTIASNGSFTFAIPVAENGSYSVTVGAQPLGQTCSVVNGNGTGITANVTTVGVSCSDVAGLALLAGSFYGPGSLDGTGGAASFFFPASVAVDSAGTLYVADADNCTIRKITPAGVVTTLAGKAMTWGVYDGTGAAASFNFPQGVAVDGLDTVYVADTGNSTIRKITAAGVVTTLAGRALATGSVDGNGTTARFKNPMSIAVDGPGTLYVADTFNHTIRKITPAGVVSTLAGTAGVSGSVDGTGAAARFNSPNSVAVDNAGNVYVADTYNNTVRKITQAGEVTTLAGRAGVSGSADGTGAGAAFSSPDGVAVDSAGNLYVTDAGNNTVRKVTPAGVVTTLAGALKVSDSADGVGASAHFVIPYGVAVDTAGGLYVTDVGGSTIRKITPAGEVSTFAGTAAQAGSVDGSGAAARFFNPYGVAADGDGNLYAADEVNGTIRKITPAGVASTLAGTARVWGGADGTGAAASFYTPYGVAADSAGNVYVADTSNSTIRKVISAGVVTTLAGTADQVGSADGTGSAARFTYPMGVAVDGAGNLYVADTWNSTIRKVSPAGVVTTLAGGPGLIGHVDGTATEARFNKPTGVAVDSAGNVYVADSSDHTIRKVTPEGVVTTLAGLAGFAGGSDGLGTGAQFNAPTGVAVDGAGNVYVADSQNYAIRKISPGGMVTTVIGTLLVGGFRPGDLPGVIGNPYGVAISGNRVYLSSYNAILVAIFVP